jgi:hypothetical protein
MLVYFLASRNLFGPFDVFNDHLLIYSSNLVYFGAIFQEKSGNPACEERGKNINYLSDSQKRDGINSLFSSDSFFSPKPR